MAILSLAQVLILPLVLATNQLLMTLKQPPIGGCFFARLEKVRITSFIEISLRYLYIRYLLLLRISNSDAYK